MSPCRNESGWCCQGVLETCLQGTCAYHSLTVHQCQCPVGLKIRWDMNDYEWIINGYGCLLDFCINSSVFAEACECLCHVVLANAVGNVSCWEVLWPFKLRDRPQSAVSFIHQYLEKRRPILDAFVLRVRSPAALVLGSKMSDSRLVPLETKRPIYIIYINHTRPSVNTESTGSLVIDIKLSKMV